MKTLIIGASMLVFAASVHAQQRELTFEPTELRGGVVMLSTGAGGNIAYLDGADGILLVDDLLGGTGPLVEAAIADIAGEGVPRFILNTHYHGDHTGSNDHFHAEGSTIVAHHNIRTRLASSDDQSEYGFLPIMTFGADIHFHMNGETIRAFHVPAAHTDGDAIVYFEGADVLHMGDTLFSGIFPYIDVAGGGSVDGYLEAMEIGLQIARPDTQVIPGHGPLSTREDIQAAIEMLVASRAIIMPMVENGMTLEEVIAADPLAEFHDDWHWGFICTPRMVATLYFDAAGDTGTSPLATRCN